MSLFTGAVVHGSQLSLRADDVVSSGAARQEGTSSADSFPPDLFRLFVARASDLKVNLLLGCGQFNISISSLTDVPWPFQKLR